MFSSPLSVLISAFDLHPFLLKKIPVLNKRNVCVHTWLFVLGFGCSDSFFYFYLKQCVMALHHILPKYDLHG